jgi:xanthine dehydrogenase YagS FAD-binding subunit
VLGASELCVATHPSDMAVALLALDAVVHFETFDDPGSMSVNDFYRLPGDEPERDTNLPAGALITAVELPPARAGQRSAYRKVCERASYAFAVVSIAAVVEVDDGIVTSARLAFGGVAHRPWRARRAEELLIGGRAEPAAFRRALDVELAQARPLRDNAYKVGLVRDVAVTVLSDLSGAEEAA